MNPLAWKFGVSLKPPSLSDNSSDAARIASALGGQPLHIPLDILKALPAFLRDNDFTVHGVLVPSLSGCHSLVSIGRQVPYGVALDIGSTNIWGKLIDLDTGDVKSMLVMTNPQTRYGADILSRIFHVMKNGQACSKELHRCLIDAVNSVIESLCKQAGITNQSVHALVVAANTVMTHFFLDLPVDNIPVSPYIPVVNAPGIQSPKDLDINPEGIIYIFPNCGSYVGGDIVSGIIASGIYKSETPCVLIDIGTNVEVAVGTKDWILVGAGAGGPAFDEGISGIGGRAAEGAICDVSLDNAASGLKITLQTIGGTQAKRICGTGMVSLVASLYEAGIIGQNGALIAGKPHVVSDAHGTGFRLDGERLVVYQTEINNFLLSKAAMFTMLSVIVNNVGLNFSDIDKFILTGALGTHIKAKDIKTLGLLPDVSEDRIFHIENSSLAGAEKLLCDRVLLEDIAAITSLITYKEMNEDATFMNELQGAMFIPHTDMSKING